MKPDTTNSDSELRGTDRLSYAVIWCLGKLLASLPVAVARGLCAGMGTLMWRFSSRRRIILSQLHRAFPERPEAWRHEIGRRHCSRVFEMFLLTVVLYHWPERVVRERFKIGQSLRRILDEHGNKRPIFFAIPHSALMESLTLIPLLAPDCPPIITLYRPLDSPAAERYVNRSRERWGADLVARREGLLKAKNHLARAKGIVGVLFDQSPGEFGHLLLFFGRSCTATNLPGLLVAKSRALPVFLHTRREQFWGGTIEGETLPESADVAENVIAINRALEEHLRDDDEACANWLWTHKRWKGPQQSGNVFAFSTRKSYLPEQMRILGLSELPRKTIAVVRVDPRPELFFVARRLVRLLESERPDAHTILLTPPGFPARLLPAGADEMIQLTPSVGNRKQQLHQLRERSIDILLSVDNSSKAAIENRRLRAQFSAGPVPPEVRRRCYSEFVQAADTAYASDPWTHWRTLLSRTGLPADAFERIAAEDPLPDSAHGTNVSPL